MFEKHKEVGGKTKHQCARKWFVLDFGGGNKEVKWIWNLGLPIILIFRCVLMCERGISLTTCAT